MFLVEEIIIQSSKKKILLLLLGSVGFVALGFWLISFKVAILAVVALPAIIFFGFCGIYSFLKLFDKKPGLVINDKGILDKSSVVSAGLIKWENIKAISIRGVEGQKFITIEVNNPDDILARQKGLKKYLMNLNKENFKSPVQLSSVSLKINFQELYNILTKQHEAHKA